MTRKDLETLLREAQDSLRRQRPADRRVDFLTGFVTVMLGLGIVFVIGTIIVLVNHGV